LLGVRVDLRITRALKVVSEISELLYLFCSFV
jgi:hypothetical protein